MWGELLGWALFSSANPVLLGFILIVIARPRPVPNLFAYWVGCLLVNIPSFLAPLVLLHLNPTFIDIAESLTRPATAAGSTFKPVPLSLGVIALLIAVVLTLRLFASQSSATHVSGSPQQPSGRHRAPRGWRPLPTPTGHSATLLLESPASTSEPGLLNRSRGAAMGLASGVRRLLSRGQDSWQRGSPWVSFVAGLGCIPSPPVVLIVALAIAGSGAAIGIQLSAAVVFVFVMFVVVEIILVGCVVAPELTQRVMTPVNNWLQTYRRQLLITLFVVVGVWQVAAGLGIA